MLKKFRDRLILTIRDPQEGGVRAIEPHIKSGLIQSAIEGGFLVDIEISYLRNISVDYGNQILSRHYLGEPPLYRELEALAVEYEKKCRFLKIALRKSGNSSKYLISLLNRHRNLVAMETDGEPASRIVYSILGSRLIYCHILEKTSPGQISCDKAMRILNLLKKLD